MCTSLELALVPSDLNTIIFQFLENVFRFWDLKGENHAFSLSSWIEYFYDGNFPDIAQ